VPWLAVPGMGKKKTSQPSKCKNWFAPSRDGQAPTVETGRNSRRETQIRLP